MKKKRKLLKVAGITAGIAAILLALFVVAFVFNPLEGSLVDMRDVVPREVDFFVRKQRPAGDFTRFPEPEFWGEFRDSQLWRQLQQGPLVQSLRSDGYERVLQQAADAVQQVRDQSGGWIDPLRDLAGSEVILAGYFEDRTGSAPRQLPEPWWCVYARVTWRVRAAWGLARWGVVQSQAAGQGVELVSDGPLLSIRLPGGQVLYAARHLDCLMVGNSRHLIDQAQRLADGVEGEEPFGRSAKYTDGVLQRIERWTADAQPDQVNALEFSIAPNLTQGFKRTAESWPNPSHPDSMEQRVLASFLKLAGWNSISGALLFEPERVSVTGEVVLNSHMHTQFQSQFFRSEAQPRDRWLDPFLRMVPDSACAAAALRVPAGEFLHAMYDALLPDDKELINSGLRRASLQGQPLNDCRDLIDRIKISLLPRTGFVFRKNVPDPEIPVGALSPTPQVAWVFWIRDGGKPMLDELVRMLQTYAVSAFGFSKLYDLPVDNLPEPVKEFTNPQIPGTGEIAMIVFSDFFVLSNSGPLIKDILRTRYSVGRYRSIMDRDEMRTFGRELPRALNGFLYLHGPNLAEVFDSYRAFIEQFNRDPDPVWMSTVRDQVADTVRKSRFGQYATVAGMPESVRAEYEAAVVQAMRDLWARQQQAGVTQADLAPILQLRALCRGMEAAYLQMELENNYIRFQGKVIADFR